ncbi:MAG: hypothetical protein JWM69_1054, partial [Candidatus Binatus sp.]|nr:hypothetical protein [Candidatus Binatus sp.]
LEAGVPPELSSKARHAGRRDPDSRNISVETEGQLELSAGGAAYEHTQTAHRLRMCRRVAPEVHPMFN